MSGYQVTENILTSLKDKTEFMSFIIIIQSISVQYTSLETPKCCEIQFRSICIHIQHYEAKLLNLQKKNTYHKQEREKSFLGNGITTLQQIFNGYNI
jgi:hypothetical protein